MSQQFLLICLGGLLLAMVAIGLNQKIFHTFKSPKTEPPKTEPPKEPLVQIRRHHGDCVETKTTPESIATTLTPLGIKRVTAFTDPKDCISTMCGMLSTLKIEISCTLSGTGPLLRADEVYASLLFFQAHSERLKQLLYAEGEAHGTDTSSANA